MLQYIEQFGIVLSILKVSAQTIQRNCTSMTHMQCPSTNKFKAHSNGTPSMPLDPSCSHSHNRKRADCRSPLPLQITRPLI